MAVINLTPPVVSGTPQVGRTLTTTPGTWDYDLDEIAYVYDWLRCDTNGLNCTDISGEHLAQYLLTQADVGATIRARITATESSAPPPPPNTQPIPSDYVIRSGGDYSGNVTQQLYIQTTAPVRFYQCNMTYKGGTMIRTSTSYPPNVTLEKCTLDGATHRIFDADSFSAINMINCTIEQTSGITAVGNGNMKLLRNIHHNIQRVSGGVGNFFQLRISNTGTREIGWNQIINEYNESNPEDIFSIYHSSGIWMHHNYLQGQFHPGNGPGSSQNGITLDGYGGSGQPVNNNLVEQNITVRTLSIAVFPTSTGPASGNMFLNNRCVHAGYLDDGVTRFYYGQHAMHVISGGTNNHAHGNVLGFMRGSSQGSYARGTDGAFEGSPEGNGNGVDTGEWANNTHLAPYPGNITRAHEDAEWDLWQQRLTDNNITVGA